MAINGEREQMMRGMQAAFKMLKMGGVIAVITWKHSEVRAYLHDSFHILDTGLVGCLNDSFTQ